MHTTQRNANRASIVIFAALLGGCSGIASQSPQALPLGSARANQSRVGLWVTAAAVATNKWLHVTNPDDKSGLVGAAYTPSDK